MKISRNPTLLSRNAANNRIFRSWNPQINLPPYPSVAPKTGFHRECENVSTFNYETRLSLLSGTQMRSNLSPLVCSINGSRYIILLEKNGFFWKVAALFKKCHVILETECLLCPHPPLLPTCRLIKTKGILPGRCVLCGSDRGSTHGVLLRPHTHTE